MLVQHKPIELKEEMDIQKNTLFYTNMQINKKRNTEGSSILLKSSSQMYEEKEHI